MGFPSGTSGKEPPANAGDVRDMGLIPGLRKSPEREHGNSLQYSCLENLMDKGAWQCKSRIRWKCSDWKIGKTFFYMEFAHKLSPMPLELITLW